MEAEDPPDPELLERLRERAREAFSAVAAGREGVPNVTTLAELFARPFDPDDLS